MIRYHILHAYDDKRRPASGTAGHCMPVKTVHHVMHGVALRAGEGGVLTRQAHEPIRAHGPGFTARTGRAKAGRAGPRDRVAREGAGGHPGISRPCVPVWVTFGVATSPWSRPDSVTSRCCSAPRLGHVRRGRVPPRSRPISVTSPWVTSPWVTSHLGHVPPRSRPTSVASHLDRVPMGHIPSQGKPGRLEVRR